MRKFAKKSICDRQMLFLARERLDLLELLMPGTHTALLYAHFAIGEMIEVLFAR